MPNQCNILGWENVEWPDIVADIGGNNNTLVGIGSHTLADEMVDYKRQYMPNQRNI